MKAKLTDGEKESHNMNDASNSITDMQVYICK